jgi:tRNA pseudouridine38-40 synthase
MRAHAQLERSLTPFRLMEGLNARLRPNPVAVLACRTVADDWHARFSCIARHYEYRIVTRRAPLTLTRGLAWRVPTPLDLDAMAEGAAKLLGRHDFTTFRSAHCQADNPVRTLDRLEVIGGPNGGISIHTSARSFLHHQVRSMVGCLALVGRGQWTPDDMRTALKARNRAALGLNAPPDGLYFVRADYPGEVSG